MNKLKISQLSPLITLIAMFLLLTTFADAGGLETLKNTIGRFAETIIGISSAIIVVAIIWAGFKVAFGAGWADVSNVVMGSLIIGSAGVIAGMLLGDSGVAAVGGV